MLYNPRSVSRGAVWVRRLWHYCFHYKLGLLCSSNGSRQQSDGAGVVVGVGGSGHPVPALVLWMATRWKEECGRAGGNHQGEWLILSLSLFLCLARFFFTFFNVDESTVSGNVSFMKVKPIYNKYLYKTGQFNLTVLLLQCCKCCAEFRSHISHGLIF